MTIFSALVFLYNVNVIIFQFFFFPVVILPLIISRTLRKRTFEVINETRTELQLDSDQKHNW